MNINDNFSTNIKISIKTQDGKIVREIFKTNKLTFEGADIIAAAISQRGILDLTGLYIRYAQNETDAKATNTNFGETKDIRKVTMSDFDDNTGTAGGAFISNGDVDPPTPSSEDYQGNKVLHNFAYASGDLGANFVANASEIYFMGLVKEGGAEPYGYSSAGDKVFSVLSFSEDEKFTLSPGQQIDVAYDITILA
mgnify:CR=1 FL=1